MTDEELVAQAVTELAPLHTQQARAERLLLQQLPAGLAAAVLREETLDQLMSIPGNHPNPWYRYLHLEAAWARAEGWEPYRRPGMWGMLVGGDEPVQLRYARMDLRQDQRMNESP